MSNSNTNLQTQSSNALHNAIMEAGSKDRPPMLAPESRDTLTPNLTVNSSTIVSKIHHTRINGLRRQFQLLKVVLKQLQKGIWRTIRMFHKTYAFNAEAEAVQIILIGIDNDIYSTVDACPNACEMWKAIERLIKMYYS
ncbi:hypothetical protein Tco_0965437 [Tanacetum coccineum]